MAQCSLGLCYKNGVGVAADRKKAKRFFKLAAKQGNATAHSMLAQLEAESGKDANLQKAQKHIRKAQAVLQADNSVGSAVFKRAAQAVYDDANLASLFRCRNEGCSVAYSEDVSVQSAKLKSCARCRKVVYCSVECQTADWKARHKHECGKRLEEGEPFLLCKLKSRPELNGCRVEVERGMDEATCEVSVRVVAEASQAAVSSKEEKQEEEEEESKGEEADGGSKAASVVGLVLSVKAKNLQELL